MRSSIGGWVENSRSSEPPARGLTMNMCEVAGVASVIGARCEAICNLCSAPARASGLPQILAP